MFGIHGVNGVLFRGKLDEMPAVRPVARQQAVTAIGGTLSAAGVLAQELPPARENPRVSAYRSMLHVDQERGPLVHARQIMATEVITVAAQHEVSRAWRTLSRHHIHQAPVVDSTNALVGIVSERDLLTAFNLDDDQIRDVLSRRVSDVMSSPVVAADPLTDIRLIARVMLERGVDGVPIVDGEQALVGFVSRGDVLRAIVAIPPLSLWR